MGYVDDFLFVQDRETILYYSLLCIIVAWGTSELGQVTAGQLNNLDWMDVQLDQRFPPHTTRKSG